MYTTYFAMMIWILFLHMEIKIIVILQGNLFSRKQKPTLSQYQHCLPNDNLINR
jgi:hypothetical protein